MNPARIIKRKLKEVLFGASQPMRTEVATCREHIDSRIARLPDPRPHDVYWIDECIRCLEKIPGILDPLEGYALFELAKDGTAAAPVVEVGSYLGKSTSYMALGSMVANNAGVVAIDMFPAQTDWFKGEDGYWHIRGSDYYIEESLYREREHFFYGGGHYQNTLDIFRDIQRKVNLERQITPFKGNSASFMATQGADARFRMIFIDGDHTYQGVKKDIEALSGALVSGGYLCFHDYCPSFPGVIQAVDELVFSSPRYQHRCLVRSLAVARKV